MKKGTNPVHTKGYRNVFCPYYRNCLDHASMNYWDYWNCSRCRYQKAQKSIADTLISTASTDPYYSLSPSIQGKEKTI